MPRHHASTRFPFYGIEIDKLQNDRYRVEVRCEVFNQDKDWFYSNRDSFWKEFGALYSSTLGGDVGQAQWRADVGEEYENLRLIDTSFGYIPNKETPIITFVYETLSTSFVQIKDDTIDYELNGLRRVQRESIAIARTGYSKTVGVTTISHQINNEAAVTLYLSKYKVDDTDSYRRVQEVYLEAGTLSETLDNVGSQKAKVIETIGADPTTPSGYSLASKQESDFEGFQTNRFTFLKPSILSLQQDFNNGLKRVLVQAFGMTDAAVSSELPAITGSHELISQTESDYEGIKTSTFQYQLDESFTEDYELNGLKRISIVELSTTNFTARDIGVEGLAATPQVGLYLGAQDIDNGGDIKVRRSVWLEAGVLSRSTQTKSNGKLIIETVEALVEAPVAETAGAVQIGNDVSNVEGIPTRRFTFAKGDGQISVDSRPAPAQLAGCKYVTVRSLGTPVTPTGVLVAESETESDGYITYEKTALQGTIVGTKQTYKDVVEVTDAGIVNCTQVSKSVGGISGTIAVTQVTPPRTKTLAATVTVAITTTPPDTVSLAYDLGDISCSVTSISMSENFRGTDVFTTSSGNSRYSGQRKAADMSARISTYPNCYLSSSTGSGVFSYTSSYENTSTSPNSIVAIGQTSTTRTFTDGTGSTVASYATTGVVARTSRPILTALDGTVYFEVITWSV